MSRKTIRTAVASLCAVMAAFAAYAVDTTIAINSIAQRWPWNNKVDITYTVTGGQDVSSSYFCKVVFNTVINGTPCTIDGSTLGASAAAGQHTVTWMAPDGVKSDNCTMSATICTADVPSGNDYMIIDLSTGAITYEGLYGTQAESNARYNTDVDGANVYKESKLVLRKIPAGGPYRILASSTKTTDRDYYIGIYPVTRRQYELVGGNATSDASEVEAEGNIIPHRPVVRISWSGLRTDIASTSSIPVVASANTGTFFQRLCYKTGNALAFDLPTDLMFNLAARAGVTTTYFYGDTADSSKVVCSNNSGRRTAVGSKAANEWGFYDVSGNVWERARDSYVASNWMSARDDIFTPIYDPSETRHKWIGGADYSTAYTSSFFQLDRCAGDIASADNPQFNVGFRVSVIMD